MKTYYEVMSVKPSPCVGCQVGSGSYTIGEDEKGKYIESHSCYEDCKKLKEYSEEQAGKYKV